MFSLRLPVRRSAALLSFVAIGCGDAASRDPNAVSRQPIPRGVDPQMVEWRSDGVLVPSPDSLRKVPGFVVDSVFTPEENLRRFQATAQGTPPTKLSGGASSTDDLLSRYWALLSLGDTLAMTPLIVSRAEYAYLYAPFALETAAGMPPHIAWELILAQTGRGLTRALAHAQREPQPLLGSTCADTARAVGEGQLYGPCGVIVRKASGVDTLWIAKSLFVRDGVHKFIGLQNELRAVRSVP